MDKRKVNEDLIAEWTDEPGYISPDDTAFMREVNARSRPPTTPRERKVDGIVLHIPPLVFTDWRDIQGKTFTLEGGKWMQLPPIPQPEEG